MKSNRNYSIYHTLPVFGCNNPRLGLEIAMYNNSLTFSKQGYN